MHSDVHCAPVPVPSSSCRFFPWSLQSHKLQGSDRQLVSPPLSIWQGPHEGAFRLILTARRHGQAKGEVCFRESNGLGSIMIKCDGGAHAAIANVLCCVGLGYHEPVVRCEPFHHNFALSATASLPKASHSWDFLGTVNPASSMLTVWLSVVACPFPPSPVFTVRSPDDGQAKGPVLSSPASKPQREQLDTPEKVLRSRLQALVGCANLPEMLANGDSESSSDDDSD